MLFRSQVLSNLIGNALKFTPAGGSITVRADNSDAEVLFTVRDTGVGISADNLPRVFDRFWYAGTGGGSGLGLAIVKHALLRHGGRLEIESIEGRGSTFTCHFPLDRVLEARVAASA